MKQYELAIGLRGEGNDPGAFQALFEAIEVDPNNAKAHLLLANLFLLQRDDNPTFDEKAEHHFMQVIEIQQGDYPQDQETLVADAHNGLGVLFIHQKRYVQAVEVLKKAISDMFNRQGYMAWGNLGWAYLDMGENDKAVEALSRAVRLHPHFCVGYYRLGRAHLAAKQPEKAENALTNALEADERCEAFQEAWHLRGEARMKLGRRDDARADFERCVELAANSDAGQVCSRYLDATY